MKGWIVREFGGLDAMQYEDLPVPQTGTGQVRVRVHASGMNFAETRMRAGSYSGQELPFIAGMEMAGVVDGETAGVLVGRSEAALGGVLTGTVATAAVAIASVVACGVVLAVGSGTKLATISPAVINSSGASPVVTNTCSRNW